MTGPDHYQAEELTQKAHEYLGQGNGQEPGRRRSGEA
jgi:hypothetical protein